MKSFLLTLAALASIGCSVRQVAINGLADSLAGGTSAWASDPDPDLIGEALPFALKTIESLLAESPEHEGLLQAAASGFLQYGHGFVLAEAERLEGQNYDEADRLRQRAVGLFLRARDYGLVALEGRHDGIGEQLRREPAAAAARLEISDVDLAYWTAAAWGSAISAGKDRPEIVADVEAVRATVDRLLALDEGWNRGALHEVMISLDSLPEAMGGSAARARESFDRAIELSAGERASPFVSLAVNLSVQNQDRDEFTELLEEALDVDPDADPSSRVANLLAQRRAEWLLEQADDFFYDD